MPKLRPVHYRKLCKIFERDGWIFIKQKGSHRSYRKKGFNRRIIIPTYKQIPVFIIKNNLATAQISRERYFELLSQV